MTTEKEYLKRLSPDGIVTQDGHGYSIRIDGMNDPKRADELCYLISQIPSTYKVISSGCAATNNGMEMLSSLKHLKELTVTGAHPTDDAYEALTKMKSLRKLHCSNAITDKGLKSIGQIADLSELTLACASQVTDRGLEHLMGLRGLVKLHLGGTGIERDLSWLKNLVQLQFVSLEDTRIGDEALASMSGLSHLQKLYLSHTQITDASMAILHSFPQLTHLGVSMTKLSSNGLAQIAERCPKLTHLISLGIEVDENCVHAIGSIMSLKLVMLDVQNVDGTDAGITQEQLTFLRQQLPDCDF